MHANVLPDGRVLAWGLAGHPVVWNPGSGTFTTVPSPSPVFCSGHAFMADGRLFVAGGETTTFLGRKETVIFDPVTTRWSSAGAMRYARYYPTVTTLGDGSMASVAGQDERGKEVTIPELWSGGGWRELTGAELKTADYPRLFLAPNGKLFYAGEQRGAHYLDASGNGTWARARTRSSVTRDEGSAVMYEPGKVLTLGGGLPPTRTAEIIDLSAAAPKWSSTASMAYARRFTNATLLPDGTVLVTGGTSRGDRNDERGWLDESGGVLPAERWDPRTGKWTTLASAAVPRMYHSTSVLLTDGRVLHAGSGDDPQAVDQRNGQLYSPPYLFRGERPAIADAPAVVGYGAPLEIRTPDAAAVARVTWVRLSSVTHSVDMNQRFIELAIVGRGSSTLEARTPDRPAIAPPGHYIMFVLNREGVPSLGKVVRLSQPAAAAADSGR